MTSANYKKMMKWNRRHPRGGKRQYMGAAILAEDERREAPLLGGSWYEDGREADRAAFIAEWRAETERLLKLNPKLKIVK